ncbi:Hint domain-containing protein [Anianabacter salinae]|uniref:Hint domain-containing protein n=1 Tax=Anianabacter salinae TaxID=2851023 RepID=UPI00225DE762|nr:Hint domain-containing protein [Anianabacter salinae]MBV0912927.1 Hint domain-containing protein [Anianabacter salinae]
MSFEPGGWTADRSCSTSGATSGAPDLADLANVSDAAQGADNNPGVPCFTVGSIIATARGPKPVEDVQPGERLLTRDNGFQPVLWVGRRRIGKRKLAAEPDLLPVVIAKDSLGEGVPSRDMRVSPSHGLLCKGSEACGEERLGDALARVGAPGIRTERADAVTYVHILFEQHEIVLADGVWSESFRPNSALIARMTGAQRAELVELFPALAGAGGVAFRPARQVVPAVF